MLLIISLYFKITFWESIVMDLKKDKETVYIEYRKYPLSHTDYIIMEAANKLNQLHFLPANWQSFIWNLECSFEMHFSLKNITWQPAEWLPISTWLLDHKGHNFLWSAKPKIE